MCCHGGVVEMQGSVYVPKHSDTVLSWLNALLILALWIDSRPFKTANGVRFSGHSCHFKMVTVAHVVCWDVLEESIGARFINQQSDFFILWC